MRSVRLCVIFGRILQNLNSAVVSIPQLMYVLYDAYCVNDSFVMKRHCMKRFERVKQMKSPTNKRYTHMLRGQVL